MHSHLHPRLAAFILLLLTAAAVSAIPTPHLTTVTVTTDPVNITLPIASTRHFNAKVIGAVNPAVTWTVNGGPGDAIVGTIDSNGNYLSPALPPPGYIVTIKATSIADPTAWGASTVTIRYPIPLLTSVTPNPVSPGPFTLTVNGSRFYSGAQVRWNSAPLATNFVNANQLTATGMASQLGNVSITVANPGPSSVSSPLTISVNSNIAVTVMPGATSLLAGGTQQFQATVTGNANQGVTWKVNGGDSFGTITSGGLYTAPGAIPPGSTATIVATSQVDGVTTGSATVTIQDPQLITYGRFLDQCTFGATAPMMAHAKQIGMQAFLDEQFATPESAWPNLSTATRADAVDAFFGNAATGQDQLRQRAIYALSEVIVIAMNKNTNGNEIVPWLQLLSRNAFGNYRTLLKEITLDATMGKYLDLANSGVGGGAPNENYPREVMQLFSIGLNMLNSDGSIQLNAQNQPIPTYTQTDVQQLARALTGWTYGNSSNIPPSFGSYNYYPGPMLPIASKHVGGAKTFLGQTLPAGQTIQQDLDGAIDIIFNHPNVGPFIATRLIRALVTSNPSPAYIQRVADVFNNNGVGVRGDLRAVIQAILMDQEARNDAPPSNFGRLRTPVQTIIAFSHSLNLPTGAGSQFNYLLYNMGEGMLDAPSVFAHYSPLFRIPKSAPPLFGPEFQIYSPSEAVNRANFLYPMLANPWPIHPALQPFVSIAGNAASLVNAVDNTLLYGRMLPATRTAILNALPTMPDNNQRVLTAIYLAVTSGEYLVQR